MNGPAGDCEVLVLGAGPAGTAAAMYLQKKKNSVILCDKKPFPRFKSCGGLLEENAYQAVKFTAPGSVLNRFQSIEVHMPDGGSEMLPVKSVLLDRRTFDQERLVHCRNLGVRVYEGYKAVAMKQSRNQVATFFQNGEVIISRAVISAVGGSTKIQGMPVLAAIERIPTLQAELPCLLASEYQAKVEFFPKGAGYGWIFPGRGHINAGIYSRDKKGMHRRFRSFLAKQNLPLVRGQGSQVLLRSKASPLGQGRVVLTGDAAGLANPLTGGGLMMALYSGYAAAVAVNRNGPDNALASYRVLLGRHTERPFSQKSLADSFYAQIDRSCSYSRAFFEVYRKY